MAPDFVRYKPEIETFNVLRGGEYFFMPSLSALRWIGNLDIGRR